MFDDTECETLKRGIIIAQMSNFKVILIIFSFSNLREWKRALLMFWVITVCQTELLWSIEIVILVGLKKLK